MTLRAEASAFLTQHLGFGSSPLPTNTEALASITRDAAESHYRQLDAALTLALRGDTRAIPTCRRVFTDRGFAMTNSCHEQGCAAVALALLGDTGARELFAHAPLINANREALPLAHRLLDDRFYRYIVRNGHERLTANEHIAVTALLREDKAGAASERMASVHRQITAKAPPAELLIDGRDNFVATLLSRFRQEHPDLFVYCSWCNSLLRTPRAKQCVLCGHDWHTPHT